LKLGECNAIGVFKPGAAPRTGQTISLGLDMSHACLFDPKAQTLI